MNDKIKRNFKKIWKIVSKQELRVLPGNIAFFAVLALIPIITIIIWFSSYFAISIDTVITDIKNILPPAVSNVVIKYISALYTIS